MKNLNFLKTFFLCCGATLILFSSCNDGDKDEIVPEAPISSKDINFKKEGYEVSLLPYRSDQGLNSKKASLATGSQISSLEQFKMTVSKEGKKKEAIIVKENIGEKSNNDFNLYHYDLNNQLIATIVVKSNLVIDIVLPSSSIELKSSSNRKMAVAEEQNCFERGYKEYKEFYSQGDWKEIACDIGNLFGGACTIGGVLAGAINCL